VETFLPPVVYDQHKGEQLRKPANHVASLDTEGQQRCAGAEAQPPGRLDLQEDFHFLNFSPASKRVKFQVDAVVVDDALHHPAAAKDMTFDVMDTEILKDVFSRPPFASQPCHHLALSVTRFERENGEKVAIQNDIAKKSCKQNAPLFNYYGDERIPE
jgi:hypothetical protein